MLYATPKNKNWGREDASWVVTIPDTIHDTPHDEDRLVEFCAMPKSRQEMMDFLGLNNRKHFVEHYLKPLLDTQKLEMTLPDKPKRKNQRYVKKVRI